MEEFSYQCHVRNVFLDYLLARTQIVRPGGMEKPTDAYKETHNLVLAPKDSLTGGQVSSLQVSPSNLPLDH